MEISNSIIIDLKKVDTFKIVNNVSIWPKLFSEYTKVKVLKSNLNYVKFELFWEDKEAKVQSWVSERQTDPVNYSVTGKRLYPMFPFKDMDIYWEFESIGCATKMIWTQAFEVDDSLTENDSKQIMLFLDKQTKKQMQVVRRNTIEYYSQINKKES